MPDMVMGAADLSDTTMEVNTAVVGQTSISKKDKTLLAVCENRILFFHNANPHTGNCPSNLAGHGRWRRHIWAFAALLWPQFSTSHS